MSQERTPDGDAQLRQQGLDPARLQHALHLFQTGRLTETGCAYESEKGFAELIRSTAPHARLLQDLRGNIKVQQGEVNNVEFKNIVAPLVKEFRGIGEIQPDSVDYFWNGIWLAIGNIVGYRYKIPFCDRTTEELLRLRRENQGVLLLPDEIYTPEGMARLGTIFHFNFFENGVISPEEIVLSHDDVKGGCIDIEMSGSNNANRFLRPVPTDIKNILASNHVTGQRLPTYLIGS